MPEIKSIKATTNDVSLFLLEIIEQIESGRIDADNIMFAMKQMDNSWAIGNIGLSISERQEGMAHIQMDITDSYILANRDRYFKER